MEVCSHSLEAKKELKALKPKKNSTERGFVGHVLTFSSSSSEL